MKHRNKGKNMVHNYSTDYLDDLDDQDKAYLLLKMSNEVIDGLYNIIGKTLDPDDLKDDHPLNVAIKLSRYENFINELEVD